MSTSNPFEGPLYVPETISDELDIEKEKVITKERRKEVGKIACNDCENYLKEYFAKNLQKTPPLGMIDPTRFALEAQDEGRINSQEEFELYIHMFKTRYLMGYPTEIN